MIFSIEFSLVFSLCMQKKIFGKEKVLIFVTFSSQSKE